MGSYVSIVDCKAHYNVTLNCGVQGVNQTINGTTKILPPFTSIGGYSRGEVPGDPDIAGIGVRFILALSCITHAYTKQILGVFVAVTMFSILAGLMTVIWQIFKTYRVKTTSADE